MKEKTFPGFTKFRKKLGDAVADFSNSRRKAGKRFKKAAVTISGAMKAVKKESPPRSGHTSPQHDNVTNRSILFSSYKESLLKCDFGFPKKERSLSSLFTNDISFCLIHSDTLVI